MNSCYDAINENKYTSLIMVDLNKAFGTADQNILTKKLEFYGIRGVTNQLIKIIFQIVNNMY